jgi:magnesium-transporting ATPase (P-type)
VLIRTISLSSSSRESIPTEKEAVADGGGQPATPQSSNMVFLGTSVVSGTATAVVVATGTRTAFGEIADRLAMRPPETEFERGIRQFGLLIMRAVFFLVLFIMVVSIALRHDALQPPGAKLVEVLFCAILTFGVLLYETLTDQQAPSEVGT